jgi:hypothetical protein
MTFLSVLAMEQGYARMITWIFETAKDFYLNISLNFVAMKNLTLSQY